MRLPSFIRIASRAGQLSLQVLILGSVAVILISGFVLWTDTYVTSVSRAAHKSQAFTIAEAGIEYYRWHLAHSPQDFNDGTAGAGPYIHPFYDRNNNRIGEFELDITPPTNGSTIVLIQSTGRVDADPTISKIIRARMGLASIARFSVLGNADLRFGAGTQIYGQLHSNGGVRFDGIAYNVVTSAKTSYNDPDHSGGDEFGVHTHVTPVDPAPPSAVPTRTDVFVAGRQFPVPAIDFTGITQDLANIKAAAQSDGFYASSSGSNGYGYDVVLKTDDTFDLYKVTKLVSAPHQCPSSQKNWGTWSIQNESFIANYNLPNNGLIFLEDNIWVRGQIDTARVTIAAGRFPANPGTYATITVNNDLLYTNYDGQDVIGLIAQNDFNTGLVSEDDLRVDAAIVAQYGRVGRPYFNGQKCGANALRDTITLFGMIASNERYGFAYTDGTGYQNRIIGYDGNLLYAPPPYFPITGGQYDVISWEEVK